MAHQVDADDAARAACDRVFNPRGVDAPGLGINIDKDRLGTDVAHRIRGRDVCERGDNHFVSRADSQSQEGEVDRHGPVAAGDGRACLAQAREFCLEPLQVGS